MNSDDDKPSVSGYKEAVAAILKPTEGLRREQDRLEKVIKGVALIALLSLIGVILSLWAASYARSAQCRAGNDFRRGDSRLWSEIFSFTETTPNNLTPTEKQTEEQNTIKFKAFLKQHDAQQSCPGIFFF